jgi:hypothetical protein
MRRVTSSMPPRGDGRPSVSATVSVAVDAPPGPTTTAGISHATSHWHSSPPASVNVASSSSGVPASGANRSKSRPRHPTPRTTIRRHEPSLEIVVCSLPWASW